MNISKKATTKWIGFGILPIGALIFGFWANASSFQNREALLPFTALYTETSTNILTERSFQKSLLFHAVRSDGTISSGWLGQRVGYRQIRNRKEKREVTICDFLKLKTTLDYGYIPFTFPKPALPADCRPAVLGIASLGAETIGNYTAYRYQLNTVFTDGTKREMSQWLAPSLGCWEIQQVTRKYNSQGILDGLFEKKVTEITPGEPVDALFAIPADYREVSKSEREKAVILQNVADREGPEAAATHEIPSSITSLWKQADEHYNAVAKKQWQPGSSSKR